MRIVYIGLVDFSYHCLKEVIKNGGNVVGIITKKESKYNTDFKDLTPIANMYNIPVYHVKSINSEKAFNIVSELKPDVIFCFGWSEIIKKKLLEYPSLGIIGVHPSNLPFNKGRHPLVWTLALGLEKSALTFFRMDEGADTGDIISQKEFKISYEDDANSVYEKIKQIASTQIKEFLPKLIKGKIMFIPQDKNRGNYWRKRFKIDGKIDWRMSSRAIYNLVRALTHPYVGAHCIYKGQDIKIWKVEELKNFPRNIEPGKVIEVSSKWIIVKCYDGAIKIIDHEFEKLPRKGEYLLW